MLYPDYRSVNNQYFGVFDYNSCCYPGFLNSYPNVNINEEITP